MYSLTESSMSEEQIHCVENHNRHGETILCVYIQIKIYLLFIYYIDFNIYFFRKTKRFLKCVEGFHIQYMQHLLDGSVCTDKSLMRDLSLHKRLSKHSYWTQMVLFPNIIRFSVYDAQGSSGHSSFVPVEGLIFYYSKTKIQQPLSSHTMGMKCYLKHGVD